MPDTRSERATYREEQEQLNQALRDVAFKFDPGSQQDVLDFFLQQYPAKAEQLANPILLGHFVDQSRGKHTYIISAGTQDNRRTAIVMGRRLPENNVPRVRVYFDISLQDMLYQVMVVSQSQSSLFTRVSESLERAETDQSATSDSFWQSMAGYLLSCFPESMNLISMNQIIGYLKQMPRISDHAEETFRTSAPDEYLLLGFKDN